MPYTGNLAATARYPTVDLASRLDPDHAAGAAPDAADMWGGQDAAGPGPDYGSPGLWVGGPDITAPQSTLRPDQMTHTAQCPPPLDPPRNGWVANQQVGARTMMYAHSARDADLIQSTPLQPTFDFAGQYNTVDREEGERVWEPGLTGPLARGRNGYAQNNPPSVVYGGEGMRYGYDVITYGYYRTPLPMQMRYQLRALAGQSVQFPVNTPQVQPNARASFSTGTQIAQPAPPAIPRLFAAPSTTSISDATMAAQPPAPSDVFASDGGTF